jgi:hypothetical protein
MFPMPWDPNSVIPVILIGIVRRIRSVIVVSSRWRRGHKENRRADKESKVGTAIMGVPVSVPMPGPG